jgi:hypothetical protein
MFNADATQLQLEVRRKHQKLPATIVAETGEGTAQFPDGRIVFAALDAKVQGNRARLESNPGNHRIGFWTDASDSVKWEYKPTRWGMYDVELTFSADGGEGTELQFEIAGQTFTSLGRRPAAHCYRRCRTFIFQVRAFAPRVACKKPTVAAINLRL